MYKLFILTVIETKSHTLLMQVPLGVLLKNETKHEDMIDIMLSLQQYVPTVHSMTDRDIQSTGEKVQVSNLLKADLA